MKIEVINRSKHDLPSYETIASAGVDLKANLDAAVIIESMQIRLIPTGLFIELPIGYEAQIRPRSGLALNHGIGILNSPGTIDSDYRGEIGVILINLSDEQFVVHDGDRIGQMIISRYQRIEWILVNELSKTERDKGGFGHTGKR